jgi:hypothetical protein
MLFPIGELDRRKYSCGALTGMVTNAKVGIHYWEDMQMRTYEKDGKHVVITDEHMLDREYEKKKKKRARLERFIDDGVGLIITYPDGK